MDGTLLNENLDITNRTTEAILTAQDRGIEFAVATGRTVDFGYSLVKEKGIRSPFIDLNGARLFDENENVQFTHKIKSNDLKVLFQIMDHYDVHNEVITENKIYSDNSLEEHIISYKEVFKDINKSISDEEVTKYVLKHLEEHKIHQISNFNLLLDDSDDKILKVLLNSHENPKLLQEIKTEIMQHSSELIVTSASNFNLEINHIQANKGQAVAELAQMRGYQADEVITIGDNINDLTMLEWASHSYAVDNAHTLAKKAATYSAPSHKYEAVAQIIEKVLAGERLTF